MFCFRHAAAFEVPGPELQEIMFVRPNEIQNSTLFFGQKHENPLLCRSVSCKLSFSCRGKGREREQAFFYFLFLLLLPLPQLMAYLEQYRAQKVGNLQLAGVNPLQAYSIYERIGRLDFLLGKMNPLERAKFENVFSALKEWDAEAAATAARDSLLNHVQHCVLLG